MSNQNEIVLDIEANGFIFESTKIWTVCAKHLPSGESVKVNPFKDRGAKDTLMEFIFANEGDTRIIGHNILGYDMFVLRNLLGLDFTVGKDTIEGREVQFIDTFYLSMFLNPDRIGHGIEAFGKELGLPKIDWRGKAVELGLIDAKAPKGEEFMQWHPEMDVYCQRDVDVNEMVYNYLLAEWKEVYGTPFSVTDAYKCGQKSFFLMSCQELAGFKFDIPAAEALRERIDGMMEEIRAEVEPQLPPRELKKTEQKDYVMPAKPFKKNGEFSSHMFRFIEKHSAEVLDDNKVRVYDKVYEIESSRILDIQKPMEMANQEQIKDWLLESGWKPTLWNFKRDASGKPMRDIKTRKLIPTSPKMQEQGKLCPNLEKMEGPLVKLVVKWMSLRNRRSAITGWLENDRLQMDGRLGAGRTGIAATHRQKHKTVVNIPKADEKVLLGHEMRSLWIAEERMLIAAGDAAALEGRVQGHYTYLYDGGETARELIEGDIHSKNALAFFGHLPEMKKFIGLPLNVVKEDPAFKPYRNKSKNGFYAILYGAGGPKVASTLGLPESMGQELMEKFWNANLGTKNLKEKLETYWQMRGKSKYLPAIDGRILMTRKKSALLNTIFQSCGGIVMDYACCYMDAWLGKIYWDEMRRPYYLYKGEVVRRIAYMHDEMEFECGEAVAEEVSKMIEKAIEKAGQHLKIKVVLAGEGQVGVNWCEVH